VCLGSFIMISGISNSWHLCVFFPVRLSDVLQEWTPTFLKPDMWLLGVDDPPAHYDGRNEASSRGLHVHQVTILSRDKVTS